MENYMRADEARRCAKEGCGKAATGKSKYCPECAAIARQKWLEMIRGKVEEKAGREDGFEKLLADAIAAGKAAAEAKVPVPMVVEQHANQLNDNSPVQQRWVVEGGVCGFAWVNIKPGTCSFARFLAKRKLASKGYYGGMEYHVGGYGQSMERKEAFARGFAGVLCAAGIKAYVESRMD